MKLKDKILAATSVEQINSVLEELKTTKHALTSREELNSYLKNKVNELGVIYDKEAKRYIPITEEGN